MMHRVPLRLAGLHCSSMLQISVDSPLVLKAAISVIPHRYTAQQVIICSTKVARVRYYNVHATEVPLHLPCVAYRSENAVLLLQPCPAVLAQHRADCCAV